MPAEPVPAAHTPTAPMPAAPIPAEPLLDSGRFARGPFAPVTEEVTAFDLPVTGRLPAGLDGRYLRNGPNPLGLDEPVQHWFLGPGMVHGVRLRDGRAEWYRNRWVRSRQVAGALGEQWPGGPVHAGMDFAANTHVVAHAGRILATVEAGPLPYELTDELDTVGPCDFGGTLPGGYAAHTKLDRRTGDLHAVAYFWGWDHVQHVVIGPDGRVGGTTDVPVPDGPMMHDFALTERYVVLLDLPVTFSMPAAVSGSPLPYAWNAGHQARLGLLPREGAVREVRWFEVDPCWVFHTLNAYDDGDRVVVDVCRYEGSYDLSALTGRGPLTLDRWTVDPAAGTVALQRLDDRPQEFPRVDERVVSRPHRYGYGAVIGEVNPSTVRMSGTFQDGAFASALLKHDLAAGAVEAHRFPRDATVGEAVFVPSAPDAAEDDGYVLAFVHDPDRGATDLVVLAAQDFAGEPVARVHLPARVPLGFHGSWAADR
ncbi:carotenoid oxygenase family protein [Geodermatophilus sp. YIM 151500]|uniref:carotenoid oxygenase family protein n=1 Tax=Geodermatophilus sp. YIM 151500 TaxID=2984531 RepID=UPI0021E3AD5F|nr:carotenoid oxygenase family protein [Geodermatophilus sp. YIM 151500]MCV2489270.1 carotenoid oxygenase family protein [Geodermatophilus sp. YIM 151500]